MTLSYQYGLQVWDANGPTGVYVDTDEMERPGITRHWFTVKRDGVDAVRAFVGVPTGEDEADACAAAYAEIVAELEANGAG